MNLASSAETSAQPAEGNQLPLWIKLIYGTGDWSMATFGTIRQIFYAIFLTDVVGIEPRLASFAAFVGIVWDAINDPLVGNLSDKLRTRWGRRRPFLLFFSIPFGLSFMLLWWAPPWQSQVMLMIHVMLAYMISDTMQTLVTVPYFALTAEMTRDYDERTSLTTFRMFFNLLASMAAAVGAPLVVDAVMARGGTAQQGYLLVSAIFGGLAIIPFMAIFAVVREDMDQDDDSAPMASFRETMQTAWRNVPFRYATVIYMLNWITFDLVGLMLPFFLTYWVASGDLLAQGSLLGMSMSLESIVLGLMLIVAIISLPIWNWLAQRLSKRVAYIIGMAFWAIVECLILLVMPGQTTFIIILGIMTGLSVSTAHVLPDAIFPDVIEWDELRTGQRHEGIYYGAKNFIRKLTGAVAIFVALQVLGWAGYQAPPQGATQFAQSDKVLTAMRMLTGPAGAVLLISAIAVTWFYPLTRERHARVRRLLAHREDQRRRRAKRETTKRQA